MSVDRELVERFYKVLVEEIRVRRPQYLREAFTVAEIYQDLVPYRSHRDRIGASMNGDYEHALLELLAGEGGFVQLQSDPARKRLLEELDSLNPNTGIFRDYAALDVRLNPTLIPAEPAASQARSSSPQADGDGSPPPQQAETGGDPWKDMMTAGSPPVEGQAAPRLNPAISRVQRPQPAAHKPAAEAKRAAASAPSNCRWCRKDLPKREKLRFCPHCGKDVNLIPCPTCGEELEAGWQFCIACGTKVPAGV
jgi:hypothetical protein